jgi:hypothetical protein
MIYICLNKNAMCTGIILKNGDRLQSVGDVEKHFNVNLDSYKESYYGELDRECCLCQIDLQKFMSEEPRKSQFEYDYVEYWENES